MHPFVLLFSGKIDCTFKTIVKVCGCCDKPYIWRQRKVVAYVIRALFIIQIHPDHSGYRGFHGNTGSLLLYTALSDALVCHLRYDTGSSSGSAGFQPVHRHLLPWNDASYRAGICQLAHKGRMLREEAICCLWHMFLHKG